MASHVCYCICEYATQEADHRTAALLGLVKGGGPLGLGELSLRVGPGLLFPREALINYLRAVGA